MRLRLSTDAARVYPVTMRFIIAVALTTACLVTAPVRTIDAETISVNTAEDELNSDGDCALREAIQAANADTNVDGCPAGDATDTIILPAGSFMLTLVGANEEGNATGDLDITANLRIEGATAEASVIDGQQIDRVLDIHSGVSVELYRLRINNGRSPDSHGDGGGIRNAGWLTLRYSMVTNNTSGIGGDGGGIWNTGDLTLENSTVSGNVGGFDGNIDGNAGNGGGLWNAGTLTIANSTVSGNAAGAGNLGDGSGGNGGGIWNSGTLSLNFATVVDNRSGIGGDWDGFAGGIYNSGAAGLRNTILANNAMGFGGYQSPYPECYGTLTSQDYNLIENINDCTVTGVSTHNIIGQDPNLAPLQNYGGNTRTHALQSPSPAINRIPQGTNGCGDGSASIDQRGVDRPQGIGCDMGAFEVGPAVPPSIRIECSDLALRLTWASVPADSGYKIHRSAQPYFTPDESTYVTTLGADATDWIQDGACSNAENYFYVIMGVASTGNESGASNRVGKVAFPVTSGA